MATSFSARKFTCIKLSARKQQTPQQTSYILEHLLSLKVLQVKMSMTDPYESHIARRPFLVVKEYNRCQHCLHHVDALNIACWVRVVASRY